MTPVNLQSEYNHCAGVQSQNVQPILRRVTKQRSNKRLPHNSQGQPYQREKMNWQYQLNHQARIWIKYIANGFSRNRNSARTRTEKPSDSKKTQQISEERRASIPLRTNLIYYMNGKKELNGKTGKRILKNTANRLTRKIEREKR